MINIAKSDCKATGQMAKYLTVEKITVKHVANWPHAYFYPKINDKKNLIFPWFKIFILIGK